MKFRLGFVTNSSSTSFTCWGMPKEELISKLSNQTTVKLFLKAYLNYAAEGYNNFSSELVEWPEEAQADEIKEILTYKYEGQEMLKSLAQFTIKGYELESDYIGISVPTAIGLFPEEPAKNLQAKVIALFNQLFELSLTEKDITFIQEAWRSG